MDMKLLARMFVAAVAVALFVSGCGDEPAKAPKTGSGAKPKSTSSTSGLQRVGAGRLVSDQNVMYLVGDNAPFNGVAYWVFEDGKTRHETNFRDGIREGRELWWHSDGKRAGEATYAKDQLDGLYQEWHPNGQKKHSMNYINGAADGRDIWYYENGKELSLTIYAAGLREGIATGWHDNGKKSWEAHWAADAPQKEFTEWHPNGQMLSQREYEGGIQVGKETSWDENGIKTKEVQWRAGLREGPSEEWYPGGKKMFDITYVAGNREGLATGWYESGAKAYEITYKADVQVSMKEWSADGTLLGARKPPVIPPVPIGRMQVWTLVQLRMIYVGKPETTISTVFGEPDENANDKWLYSKIKLQNPAAANTPLFGDVQFTIRAGKVELVELQ